MRKSVSLAFAAEDQAFCSELAALLESGCDVLCTGRAVVPGSSTLFEAAEGGGSSDFLVLVLSRDACPAPWNWPEWDRHIVQEAAQMKTSIFTVALDSCAFPALLRRQNFVDAKVDQRQAMRMLKRWIRRRALGLAGSPRLSFSADFESLYTELDDRPGILTYSGEEAYRFAEECADDFDAVLTIPCHARSLARICGELSQQLGLTLTEPAEFNARKIQSVLCERRCLLLLDAPAPEIREALLPAGQTSALVTDFPVRVAESPDTFEYGRRLMDEQRYAEAYELFNQLCRSDVSARACRRELAWILEHWGRFEEARALRLIDVEPFTQLTLF